jgi:protein O-GlcNAc transferase
MLTVSKAEELIAPDLAAYETLALDLGRSPARLAAIREHLTQTRSCNPLFDTAALCRDLETAYGTMWDIHPKGQKPRGFSVNIAAPADRGLH